MDSNERQFSLVHRDGQVFLHRDGDEVPVRIVWTRPISQRTSKVSILGKDKKEIALIDDLDELDAESRAVAHAALEEGYFLPVITRVKRTDPRFGNRYWEVETDRGPREFVLKDVNRNVIWVTDDRLIIRDTLGNRYEIPSLRALDRRSQINVDKVV